MKKRISFVLLTMVLSLMYVSAQSQKMNATDFKKTVEKAKPVLIDVRTNQEFAQGHIDKAINIVLSDPDFVAKVKKAAGKSKTVALYCRSGHRSGIATGMLKDAGLKIYELSGGIIQWQQSGYQLKN